MNIPFTRERAIIHAQAMIARDLALSIATAGRITDFNDGSNAKDFYLAIGGRFEHLDNKIQGALKRAIPTMVYEFFGFGDGIITDVGFPLLPAMPAAGLVRFSRTVGTVNDIDIPLGFLVRVAAVGSVAEKVYQVSVPLAIPSGQNFGETSVTALASGRIGNTPAQTVRLKDTLSGVASATNPGAFGNGSEIETDEARRIRFNKFIRNLARAQEPGLEVGATLTALIVAGLVTEQVFFARATNVEGKRGLVDLFVDNGGATATEPLLDAVRATINGGYTPSAVRIHGYKAAGVVVRVKAVTQKIVPVTLAIKVSPGFRYSAVAPEVVEAVSAYLFDLGVFQDLIQSVLACTAQSVRGVADVEIATPLDNITTAAGDRILPGVVAISQML